MFQGLAELGNISDDEDMDLDESEIDEGKEPVIPCTSCLQDCSSVIEDGEYEDVVRIRYSIVVRTLDKSAKPLEYWVFDIAFDGN